MTAAGRASLRAAVLAVTVTAVDQGTKALVRSTVERGERDPIFFGLELVNTRNTGVAFGFLSDTGAGGLVLAFTVVALVALITWFAFNRARPLAWLPTGLLLGGAVGNLIDRIWDVGVTDFLDPPWWPAFNMADVGITFGVLALLYVLEGPATRRGDPGTGGPEPGGDRGEPPDATTGPGGGRETKASTRLDGA